jgi:hypothetical protein
VTVTAHPPERARRGGSVVLPCGCCCCCCCCLHTIGGLVGGVVGSVQNVEKAPRRVLDPDFPFPYRRDEFEEEGTFPAGLLYWLLVLLLMAATAVYFFLQQGARDPNDLLLGLLVALMILPGLQLGASALSAAAVGFFYADKRPAFARVGKITLWSFVGTLAGLALMAGCFGILTLGR